MVDRFNNPSAAPKHLPFDDPGFANYQGGKFSGVQAQLPYIKALGAGAIWLSPVLKTCASTRRITVMASTITSRPSPGSPTTRRRPTTSCAPWSMPRMRRGSTSSSISS